MSAGNRYPDYQPVLNALISGSSRNFQQSDFLKPCLVTVSQADSRPYSSWARPINPDVPLAMYLIAIFRVRKNVFCQHKVHLLGVILAGCIWLSTSWSTKAQNAPSVPGNSPDGVQRHWEHFGYLIRLKNDIRHLLF